ncbi:V-type ATP synthase subunit B [Ignisphaera sp. 4213-co]|uniref:A-type ATP synthase subunit B n=1 Tax=Ignisphaera cupida TaxID=3050454 RepID=A0ABD4Z3W2_9CREN|nr:V-type ATP synthase subunit B [Ignisphaera sp. 4213-co]MDK6027991.1 V-type ATP synthase subunit B [Ignisphaera sp. 4213-co]
MSKAVEIPKLTSKASKQIIGTRGALIFVKALGGIRYGELVEIDVDGTTRLGQVIDVSKDVAIIQVFGTSLGITTGKTVIRFRGETLSIPVSSDMLGRIFDGLARPIDGGPSIVPEDYLDIHGEPLNPAIRVPPSEFIETGVSVIDGMLTLVRGQKLPIFSGSGLPHNRLAMQIVRQAAVRGSGEKFAVVFGAVGVTHEEAMYFLNELRSMGALDRTIAFIAPASASTVEKLALPRTALTAAEFLAWRYDMHVLTILTDMTNYCEALKEISAAREEVPGRRGYPGYMYTDLATMYERAGRTASKKGSMTIMPILTMPDDDITHPIPDLTGYITEGQIVLSRDMWRKGIYPPVDVFLSLSRLMKEGIGPGKTREDHREVFAQLMAAYSEGTYLRELVTIVGIESLTPRDRKYLDFADEFEKRFINQGEYERRPIEKTLDIAWELFAMLPEDELRQIRPETIKRYHPKYRGS